MHAFLVHVATRDPARLEIKFWACAATTALFGLS